MIASLRSHHMALDSECKQPAPISNPSSLRAGCGRLLAGRLRAGRVRANPAAVADQVCLRARAGCQKTGPGLSEPVGLA